MPPVIVISVCPLLPTCPLPNTSFSEAAYISCYLLSVALENIFAQKHEFQDLFEIFGWVEFIHVVLKGVRESDKRQKESLPVES